MLLFGNKKNILINISYLDQIYGVIVSMLELANLHE